jgi:hypothetical protein
MDGTEGKKDALQPGAEQSLTDRQETPKKEAKTHYTEEEVNEKIQADRIARGRDAKSLADKEASLKAEREAVEADKVKIADWQRQRDETELAEARRDPDKLAAWQKKQNEKTRDAEFATREANLKKREVDLTKREAEHEAEIQAAQETRMEITLWEIGAKHKVDPVTLKDTMKDLNLTTVEQAEALAKRLAESETKPEFNPITGVTSGTKKNLSSSNPDEELEEGFRRLKKK